MSALWWFLAGGAVAALAAYHLAQDMLRDAYLDGAASMLIEAQAMQQYMYRELVGEPNAGPMLHTIDAVVEGLNKSLKEAR